jgi:hypothetical protein
MAEKKKAPRKKTPTTVSPEEIQRFKKQVAVAIRAAKTVEIRLDDVAADIDRISTEMPKPPRVIEGEKDLKEAQQVLRVMQVKRRRLGQMQQACTRAKTYWDWLIEETTGWILSQPSVAALKNDTIRKHWIRKVMGGFLKRQALLKGYIKEIEDLLWIIKDNQRAVVGMVAAWKEESWAMRQGME